MTLGVSLYDLGFNFPFPHPQDGRGWILLTLLAFSNIPQCPGPCYIVIQAKDFTALQVTCLCVVWGGLGWGVIAGGSFFFNFRRVSHAFSSIYPWQKQQTYQNKKPHFPVKGVVGNYESCKFQCGTSWLITDGFSEVLGISCFSVALVKYKAKCGQ